MLGEHTRLVSTFVTNALHDRLDGVFLKWGKGFKASKSGPNDLVGSFISELQAFEH